MTTPDDRPPLGELADEDDTLGWDRSKHGTFAEHAAPDDAVTTVPAEDYLNMERPAEGGGG